MSSEEKFEIKHNTDVVVVDASTEMLNVRQHSAIVGDGESSRAEVRHGLGSMGVLVTVLECDAREQWHQVFNVTITQKDPDTVVVQRKWMELMDCGCARTIEHPIPKDGWRVLVIG